MSSANQSYEIRPESIKTFIEDRTVKLPRFQRKQTWDEKKDFALAISVFKGFPLGVVVINKEVENRKPLKWLLDGRQRRNALTNMLLDPEAIYVWARRFVGFKQSAEATDIEDLYWKKIEEYLGADDTDEKDDQSQEELNIPSPDVPESSQDEEPTSEFKSGAKTKQIGSRYHDLDLLLDLILLTHKKNKRRSGFTQPFDFSDFIENLDYVDSVAGKACLNSKKLRIWMHEYRNHCANNEQAHLNKERFFNYLKSRYNNSEPKLKQKIDREWERIKARFDCIEIIENKLQETKIGLIELTGANASDAQTTFKIINSSGTPLSAVEILSAKPSWNEPITNPSAQLVQATTDLYAAIDVVQDGVVKWDAPATFARRLNNLRFILSDYDYSESQQLAKSITLGFKLVSAIHEKGISKVHIDALSQNGKINWQLDIDAAVKDFNDIGKILGDDTFFAYFATWKISLMDLTSDAIAIDFLVRVYLDWKRKGKPLGTSAQTKKFLKNARILFDNLIYEYLTRQWRGSSDARVAEHIREFDSEPVLYQPRPKEDWNKMIEEVIDSHTIGKIRLKTGNVDPLLKPILYYQYVLSQQRGPDGVGVTVEVDHTIPQSELESSTLDGKELKAHNLFNLALLPKKENIWKNDKWLKLIDNTWLKDQVSLYTGIPISDFERFSTVQSMDALKKLRKGIYKEAFGKKRDDLFVG
jgi:hypothetical protein